MFSHTSLNSKIIWDTLFFHRRSVMLMLVDCERHNKTPRLMYLEVIHCEFLCCFVYVIARSHSPLTFNLDNKVPLEKYPPKRDQYFFFSEKALLFFFLQTHIFLLWTKSSIFHHWRLVSKMRWPCWNAHSQSSYNKFFGKFGKILFLRLFDESQICARNLCRISLLWGYGYNPNQNSFSLH